MTAEERKAIAMRHSDEHGSEAGLCGRHYPTCCSYHEGFDAALALLVPTASSHLWSIKAP